MSDRPPAKIPVNNRIYPANNTLLENPQSEDDPTSIFDSLYDTPRSRRIRERNMKKDDNNNNNNTNLTLVEPDTAEQFPSPSPSKPVTSPAKMPSSPHGHPLVQNLRDKNVEFVTPSPKATAGNTVVTRSSGGGFGSNLRAKLKGMMGFGAGSGDDAEGEVVGGNEEKTTAEGADESQIPVDPLLQDVKGKYKAKQEEKEEKGDDDAFGDSFEREMSKTAKSLIQDSQDTRDGDKYESEVSQMAKSTIDDSQEGEKEEDDELQYIKTEELANFAKLQPRVEVKVEEEVTKLEVEVEEVIEEEITTIKNEATATPAANIDNKNSGNMLAPTTPASARQTRSRSSLSGPGTGPTKRQSITAETATPDPKKAKLSTPSNPASAPERRSYTRVKSQKAPSSAISTPSHPRIKQKSTPAKTTPAKITSSPASFITEDNTRYDDEVYTVESLLGRRKIREVRKHRKTVDRWDYLVKWEGYAAEKADWIKEGDIFCKGLIEKFDDQYPREEKETVIDVEVKI